jgi:hypothetical protein
MLIELTAETVLKNSGTGQRVTLAPGQVIDLPGQIAEKVLEKGKGRLAALPADCEGCCMEIEGMCYDRIRGIVCADAVNGCRHLEHMKPRQQRPN